MDDWVYKISGHISYSMVNILYSLIDNSLFRNIYGGYLSGEVINPARAALRRVLQAARVKLLGSRGIGDIYRNLWYIDAMCYRLNYSDPLQCQRDVMFTRNPFMDIVQTSDK